jgi:hypothetical protein
MAQLALLIYVFTRIYNALGESHQRIRSSGCQVSNLRDATHSHIGRFGWTGALAAGSSD